MGGKNYQLRMLAPEFPCGYILGLVLYMFGFQNVQRSKFLMLAILWYLDSESNGEKKKISPLHYLTSLE